MRINFAAMEVWRRKIAGLSGCETLFSLAIPSWTHTPVRRACAGSPTFHWTDECALENCFVWMLENYGLSGEFTKLPLSFRRNN
jgi:hypothetical protein